MVTRVNTVDYANAEVSEAAWNLGNYSDIVIYESSVTIGNLLNASRSVQISQDQIVDALNYVIIDLLLVKSDLIHLILLGPSKYFQGFWVHYILHHTNYCTAQCRSHLYISKKKVYCAIKYHLDSHVFDVCDLLCLRSHLLLCNYPQRGRLQIYRIRES